MMWDELTGLLAEYESSVITGVDINGYPVSLRCNPRVDVDAKVLRYDLPENLGIQPGPASLLCHKHDEWLFNMTSFGVRGVLERDGDSWLLHPKRIIPGAGLGPMDLLNLVRNGRKNTKRYLERRGLARPKIPWDEVKAAYKDVKKER